MHAQQDQDGTWTLTADGSRAAACGLAAAATGAAALAGGHIGRGGITQIAFAAAMVVCAMDGVLRSPAGQAGTGRGAFGKRGFTGGAVAVGALLVPAVCGVVLGAGWATSLLTTLAAGCACASLAAGRLSRGLPSRASRVPARAGRRPSGEPEAISAAGAGYGGRRFAGPVTTAAGACPATGGPARAGRTGRSGWPRRPSGRPA
jgi:hypothetical protein